MNEENKVVTNNSIPEETPQIPTKKPHDNKMALFSIVTLVFGIIMVVSLVVALGTKNEKAEELQQPPVEVTENAEKEKEKMEIQNDDELGTKKLLSEIEDLEFDKIFEDFSNQKFDENMY